MHQARVQPSQAPPAVHSQSGVVLVMALLVMLILAVVVSQLLFSSTIDHQLAENQALELQMEKLAEAAFLKAQAALILDAEEDSMSAEGDAGGSPLEGSGLSGLGGGQGQQVQGPGSGASSGRVDSLDETWALGDLPFELGYDAGLQVKILVEDEDRKINLLVLGAQEEEWRELWRERVVRLLDVMRDGQNRDLSRGDADDLVQRWEAWMKGDRWDQELEDPPRAEAGWMTEGLESMQPPLSLGELVLAGGVDRSLLYGFAMGDRESEDEEWVPGLSQVLTVTSNLVLEDEDSEGDPDPDADPEEPEDGATFDETGQLIKEKAAPGMNNGRLNVNTASLEVLRSLFPEDEVPASAWEEYDEHRREYMEDLIEDGGFSDEEQLEPEVGAPRYPLATVDDLRNFNGFSESGSFLNPETWDSLRNLLSVESNVFTITVVVATQEQPTRFYVARSVVWRRIQDNGEAECIAVVPFERLPNEAIDLSEVREELDEWGWDY